MAPTGEGKENYTTTCTVRLPSTQTLLAAPHSSQCKKKTLPPPLHFHDVRHHQFLVFQLRSHHQYNGTPELLCRGRAAGKRRPMERGTPE
jgi:hypothetical protein